MEKLKPGSQSACQIDALNRATYMLRNKKDRRKVILLIAETLDRGSEARLRDVATNVQIYNIDVYTVNINRLATTLTQKPAYPRGSPFPAASKPVPGGAPQTPDSVAQMGGAPGNAADFIPVIEEMYRATKGIFIRNPAELLTKYTGGREFSFITQGDLERSITAIGEELHSQYLLSYSPNNKLEGGFHKIRVEVDRPNLRVRTRTGYWMAAIPDGM
jgi:VWFA-related protein